MGGTVIETESERIIRNTKTQTIIEMGREVGWDDEVILKNLQEKVGLSQEAATAYLEQYKKSLV